MFQDQSSGQYCNSSRHQTKTRPVTGPFVKRTNPLRIPIRFIPCPVIIIPFAILNPILIPFSLLVLLLILHQSPLTFYLILWGAHSLLQRLGWTHRKIPCPLPFPFIPLIPFPLPLYIPFPFTPFASFHPFFPFKARTSMSACPGGLGDQSYHSARSDACSLGSCKQSPVLH